jgi:hypothetical protein
MWKFEAASGSIGAALTAQMCCPKCGVDDEQEAFRRLRAFECSSRSDGWALQRRIRIVRIAWIEKLSVFQE